MVYFTGEKEWIQVSIKEVQVNIKTGLSGNIVFTIELDPGVDSFLNYNEEVHLDGLSTKRPVLKLLLDNDGLSGDQFLPLDGDLTIGHVKEEARPFDPEFQYQIGSSKNHGSGTGFVKAVLKTGNHAARVRSMSPADIQYAAQHLDAGLMHLMKYTFPEKG